MSGVLTTISGLTRRVKELKAPYFMVIFLFYNFFPIRI